MNMERCRAFLLSLPHVEETMQWGANLVYWVGDKAIGGKMFALINLDEAPQAGPSLVISYAAGPSRYSELLEVEGMQPAPYMARNHWVAVEGWEVLRDGQWHSELCAAHTLTLAKLRPRTVAVLHLPDKQRKKLIAERRKMAAAKVAAKA